MGAPCGHLHHLIDAPARRIHLDAEFAISRAGVQAETAVHAAVEIDLLRFIDDVERLQMRP